MIETKRQSQNYPSPELSHSPAWQALKTHFAEMRDVHMRDLFAQDDQRFDKYSVDIGHILLDYSKNRINDDTMRLLTELARQAGVEAWRERMFAGDVVNCTENRAVLHIALRNRGNQPILVDGKDVMPAVNEELEKMRVFSESVRGGSWRGFTGERITDIINIGIGGSDLGPHVITDAMKPFAQRGLNVHFVSNVDPTHLTEILKFVRPESTLFIICSKTFTTQETMMNANSAREWFMQTAGTSGDIEKHFVAVTTNRKAAVGFGIDPAYMFLFWDWVGGRYSLWSTAGLSIAVYLGMDHFEAMLAGAHEMDNHFRDSPLERNIPVILAMLGVWYNNFFAAQSHAIMSYNQYMRRFPAYLQQLDMESNGKSVDREGQRVDYLTGPIIWGETGSNCQHAFFQSLHQGTTPVPVDFIAPARTNNPLGHHHCVLLSNFFAQTRALMMGKTVEEARRELESDGVSERELELLLPHKVFEGNKPSNSIVFEKLDARTIGALFAMYEHKVFVQGIIWNINSFDQWGVELGKQLAVHIQNALSDESHVEQYDSSTNGLINYCKQHNYTM